MATVRNMAELEKALNNTMYMAIKKAQQSVYDVIQDFIKEYYKEKVFRDENGNASMIPKVYDRTFQFFNSLVKSEIKKISGGWECEVYIDYESLDYIGHSGLETVEMINRGFHAQTAINNGIYETPYNISANGHFWDDSLSEINKTKLIVRIFEEYFKKRGFNVTTK